MKISNWCILFSVLFCGMILYTDLRFRYTMEAQYTMEEYNRIFDRAAEDALTDQLPEEAMAFCRSCRKHISRCRAFMRYL